jgi:hypothetical protein
MSSLSSVRYAGGVPCRREWRLAVVGRNDGDPEGPDVGVSLDGFVAVKYRVVR